VEAQEAVITIPDSQPQIPEAEAESDNRNFVIVGGGAAGEAAAEELRRIGFSGNITLISAVPNVPIDRPNLSKDYLDGHAKPEWMPLRGKGWYSEHAIRLHLNTVVKAVHPQSHTLTLGDGSAIKYDKLLLATGAIPRRLNIPGMDLNGVFTLRSQADADAIIAAAKEGQQVVIIGASFIGTEVAASLAGGRKVTATIVAPEDTPFAHIFGDRIGQLFRQEHENNGVRFKLSNEVSQITGKEGQATGVQLASGEILDADFVVVGIGVHLATDFLKTSGLKMNERDGSIRVNEYLLTSDHDVYAAGDIARWDDGSGEGQRIEHWRVAQQQGMVAAQNMMGQEENINHHIPFFWTKQWTINLRSVGFAPQWDDIVYRGQVEEKDFIAFFVAGGQLQAAVSCNRDQETAALEFIIRDKLSLTKAQMSNPDFDLVAHATEI
jgi:NADPH-dependent 2,4-dienoyl-CoA reductase/sulfur reductase-like enzyme